MCVCVWRGGVLWIQLISCICTVAHRDLSAPMQSHLINISGDEFVAAPINNSWAQLIAILTFYNQYISLPNLLCVSEYACVCVWCVCVCWGGRLWSSTISKFISPIVSRSVSLPISAHDICLNFILILCFEHEWTANHDHYTFSPSKTREIQPTTCSGWGHSQCYAN